MVHLLINISFSLDFVRVSLKHLANIDVKLCYINVYKYQLTVSLMIQTVQKLFFQCMNFFGLL